VSEYVSKCIIRKASVSLSCLSFLRIDNHSNICQRYSRGVLHAEFTKLNQICRPSVLKFLGVKKCELWPQRQSSMMHSGFETSARANYSYSFRFRHVAHLYAKLYRAVLIMRNLPYEALN